MRKIIRPLVGAVILLSVQYRAQTGGDDWKSKILELQK